MKEGSCPAGAQFAAGLKASGCGLASIGLQWFKDGVAIPGATSLSLKVSNPTVSDSGAYYLEASCGGVRAQSAPALLSVQPKSATTTGTYDGLLAPMVSATSEMGQYGLLNVTITPAGSFSGRIQLVGTTQTLSGKFNGVGRALFGSAQTEEYMVTKGSGSSKVAVGRLVMNLEFVGEYPAVTAKLLDAADGETVMSEGEAEKAVYSSSKTLPVGMKWLPTEIYDSNSEKGVYTVVIDIPEAERSATDEKSGSDLYPEGSGYGNIMVSASGSAAYYGKLADGTSVTYSNRLSGSNRWPVFVPLYSNKGLLAGGVNFDSSDKESDASGPEMRWFKPAGSNAVPYARGWIEGVNSRLLASKYVAPTRSTKDNTNAGTVFGSAVPGVVAPQVNLSLMASGGWLSGERRYDASLSALSVFKPGGDAAKDQLKVTFTSATGVFSGSFLNPETRKSMTMNGVVFQKKQTARGNFLSPSLKSGEAPKIGAVSMTIR